MMGLGLLSGSQWLECTGKRFDKPNIIFLLTDDQRWDTLGCMGNPIIYTPNVDKLAEGGCLFTEAFVTTSICMSSRASILTGQNLSRHGINDFSQPLTENALAQTYPLLLRQAGYRVGFIGKYGVGTELPEKQFDFFYCFPGQGKYFPDEYNGEKHLTQILGERAIRFLRGCSADQPFCLCISFKAPHVLDNDPRQFLYDPAYENLYDDVTIPVPKTAAPHYFDTLPEFLRNSEARRRWQIRFSTPEKYQQSVKGYYRLITGVDVVIGRMLDILKVLNFAHNTVIIFTGDNGFYLGEHGLAGKWFMHEESIRVPLIVYDPRLPASLRGQRRNEMALNIDIAPTILNLAGLEIPDHMQGESLLPLIKGHTPDWRKEFFYEHLFEHQGIAKSEGVRTEKWKYIRYVDQKPIYEELYDLENDPHEERNLALLDNNQTILDQLRERWRFLRESVR